MTYHIGHSYCERRHGNTVSGYSRRPDPLSVVFATTPYVTGVSGSRNGLHAFSLVVQDGRELISLAMDLRSVSASVYNTSWTPSTACHVQHIRHTWGSGASHRLVTIKSHELPGLDIMFRIISPSLAHVTAFSSTRRFDGRSCCHMDIPE